MSVTSNDCIEQSGTIRRLFLIGTIAAWAVVGSMLTIATIAYGQYLMGVTTFASFAMGAGLICRIEARNAIDGYANEKD